STAELNEGHGAGRRAAAGQADSDEERDRGHDGASIVFGRAWHVVTDSRARLFNALQKFAGRNCPC
ncbi:MAG TPA: hypothetical protein VK638_32460, partial [Edaphobacter sp.]|nr:hypothetical protein [Edaphobacter sp.]